MKGFKLDANGDVQITKNKIEMVKDKELVRQTVQSVLGTNKGEWFLNADEGIQFSNILGKGNPTQSQSDTSIRRYYEGQLTDEKQKYKDLTARYEKLSALLERRLEGDI